MRLWHSQLTEVLPRQQLLGQNRECCLIESEIVKNGFVNHILVDFVNNDKGSLLLYHMRVMHEMCRRGYRVGISSIDWANKFRDTLDLDNMPLYIFEKKFNHRYMLQCLYNLQEKYDAGGVSKAEWGLIVKKFPWFKECKDV